MNIQIVAVKIDKTTLPSGQGYDSIKEFHYKSFDKLKVGDRVLVLTKYGFRTGVVTQILLKSNYAELFVIQKIDLKEYTEKVENYKETERLKKEITTELEKQQEYSKYRNLAQFGETQEIKDLAKSFLELVSK